MRACRASARLKVPPIQDLELDGGRQPCAVCILSPTPHHPDGSLPVRGWVFFQHKGTFPQHQMAGTCVRLSGQLRQKKITICPIVQMSSLACPECSR